MRPLYAEKLSARHVTESAQRILHLIPLRSGDRGLHVVDEESFVMVALWSLVRWERKVGLVALERLDIDIDSVSRRLDELLSAKAENNPVVSSEGGLMVEKTREPYKHWDFDELLEPLLRQAEHEAFALKHSYIGSEHLLLATIKLASPNLAQVLQAHDVTYERVRDSVVDILA
jgi:ATP-dependent Clp protease ATP-binding subunit ClpA